MRRRGKFHKKNRLSALTEINVTPLIDLAFALLIIFMIATPLLEQTIPIDLPSESAKKQSDLPTDFQLITIDAKGAFFLGKEPLSDKSLYKRLEEFSRLPQTPVIRIRAHKNLKYDRVVQLIDYVKQNNLTKISLDTEVK